MRLREIVTNAYSLSFSTPLDGGSWHFCDMANY